LLPKTKEVQKLRTELAKAQNAAKPDAELIKDLKNQVIDKASNKRSAALYLEEIDALSKQDKKIYEKKTKQEDVDMERVAPSGVVPAQRELFDEKDLEPLATIRATPQNFMRFLGSVEVFKLREKLNLLEKKDVEVAERMAKAPSLAVLKAQRELVNDLNKIDEVTATYRWNASQMWQGRRTIAAALDDAVEQMATATTPKIEELQRELKKYAFKQYTPEYKKLNDKIQALKNLLFEQNSKKASEYAGALYAYDLAIEERNASIDYIQEKIEDLQIRNIKDEKKILAKMERQYANQGTPAAKKAKEQIEKARAETAVADAQADVVMKQKVATKRAEEQQSKEALEQLPVIRRFTVQTRAFTKAENVKGLRAEKRKLEKQQEQHKPGTPTYTKLGQQIGVLNEEINRGIQPLLQTVVQAATTPEPAVKRESRKEGVRFAKGQTTGYDYITMTDKELDAALGKPSDVVIPSKYKTEETVTETVTETETETVTVKEAVSAFKPKKIEGVTFKDKVTPGKMLGQYVAKYITPGENGKNVGFVSVTEIKKGNETTSGSRIGENINVYDQFYKDFPFKKGSMDGKLFVHNLNVLSAKQLSDEALKKNTKFKELPAISYRKKGMAGALMDAVINYADKNNKTLFLIAKPEPGQDVNKDALSLKQLEDFYKKKGFVKRGEFMERAPQKQTAGKIVTKTITRPVTKTVTRPVNRITIENLKEKEAEARDNLEKAKADVVAQNREIAATTKALGLAKTPSKVKELKAKLAALKQAATKNKLGEKVNTLTKEYREIKV
jgi:hypothetical protein